MNEDRCVKYIGRWGVWLVHDREGKGYVDEDEVVKVDDRGIHIDLCETDEEDDEEEGCGDACEEDYADDYEEGCGE
jgi:hypothetical protein